MGAKDQDISLAEEEGCEEDGFQESSQLLNVGGYGGKDY